jgi:hypothetical protein
MHRALTCDIVESSFFGIETASRYLSTTVGMSPLELSGVLCAVRVPVRTIGFRLDDDQPYKKGAMRNEN